jgi:hypothetical protein
MSSTNEQNEVLNFANESKPKLPIGLNILTILTLIGCAWELYQNLSGFLKGRAAIDELEKAQEKMADAPAWAKKLTGPAVHDMLVKSFENRIPILIIGLIAVSLCVYGALEMRKQKKQGYYFWLIGEILPILSTFLFIGAAFFNTIFVWFLIFPAIFILLYTLQRKNLVY